MVIRLVSAAAAFSLLAAGCGGGGPARTTGAPHGGLVAYARCMRSHGVPGFPDPDSTGGIPKQQVVAARQSDPSRFDSAGTACGPLLPNGGLGPSSPALTPTDERDYLEAAACMRTHGYPSFPDPTFRNGQAHVEVPSDVNQDAPRFKHAVAFCVRLIPKGVRPGGS